MSYTGSLIRPPLRYLLKLDLIYTTGDRRGGALAEHFFKLCLTSPTRNFQPTFEYNYRFEPNKPFTSMYIKYLPGWEHTYDLSMTDLRFVLKHMEHYNYIIETNRAIQGMDDEFEDEVAT